ncbi:MAG: S41 family peptidase [Clostridia bacterium]|nr:S41 family peptidase [Clostridia bacterium]
MSKKRAVIITAIITFVCTTVLTTAVRFFNDSGLLDIIGLTGKTEYSVSSVEKAANIVSQFYYEDVDESVLYKGALEGMISALDDEYSWFVDEESFKELKEETQGEYTGIGVTVSIDDTDETITVISPIEDTPAFKAGIKPGDKIIAIDGTRVGLSNYRDAVNMLKGDSSMVGKNVVLTLKRAGTGSLEEVTLIREKIHLITVKSKMLPENVGYIRITSFGENTYNEFETNFTSLGAESLKGLVIDLRNNGGGILTSTLGVADTFLDEGLITYFQYKNGSKTEYKSDADIIDIPVVVLVNGQSASASEVLAAALHDRGRATLVGEKTYGKGVVQTVLPFIKTDKGETAIYITTSRYFTPAGVCIHGTGITPDVSVSLPEEYAKLGFDNLTLEQDNQLKIAWEMLK